jgi:hypothetical protein
MSYFTHYENYNAWKKGEIEGVLSMVHILEDDVSGNPFLVHIHCFTKAQFLAKSDDYPKSDWLIDYSLFRDEVYAYRTADVKAVCDTWGGDWPKGKSKKAYEARLKYAIDMMVDTDAE